MATFLDTFAPLTVGAMRLKLSLDASTLIPRAGGSVLVNVDYSEADPDGGVVLPLGLIIQAPTVAGYRTKTYTSVRPDQIPCPLITAGEHLVTLKELGHNLFFGALRFTVIGDPIDQPLARR
jgi:hypothetical protein